MEAKRKPTFVWDGDCGFCRYWVSRWKRLVGDAVAFKTFQELGEKPGYSSTMRYGRKAYDGAEGVFRLLSHARDARHWLRLYQNLPGFALVTEAAYRWIARHRPFALRASILLWGREAP